MKGEHNIYRIGKARDKSTKDFMEWLYGNRILWNGVLIETKKMMSFVMFLMVAQSSNDYHGKEMTNLSVFATAMLTMSTQAHQSHHTV